MSGEKFRNNPEQDRSRDTLSKITMWAVDIYNDPKVGRDLLTTAMVAQKAGVSIGTIYRYFNSRQEILDHIAPNRDQSSIPLTSYNEQEN